jgi:hypothetical protein
MQTPSAQNRRTPCPPENLQPSFHAIAVVNLFGASQALLHFLPALVFGLLWIAGVFMSAEDRTRTR